MESSEIMATENDVKLREVVVHNLNRTDLNKSLVCQASNNNINAPLSTTVHLDVYCKYPHYSCRLFIFLIRFTCARTKSENINCEARKRGHERVLEN